MANNPFIGGVNPPDTSLIGGGISQMGALSGQLNSRRVEPLISMRGGEISRLTFAGGQAIDPFNVWTPGVTTVQGILTGSGIREAAASPGVAFPSWKLIDTGAGDPFDFTGDFSAAIVFQLAPGDVTNGNYALLTAGGVSTSGWFCWVRPNTGGMVFGTSNGTTNAILAITGLVSPGVNVLCVGRAGATLLGKNGLAAIGTLAAGPVVPAVGRDTRLGWDNTVGLGAAWIYEVWASTQTPSDALFTAIATEIHNKLGITAW